MSVYLCVYICVRALGNVILREGEDGWITNTDKLREIEKRDKESDREQIQEKAVLMEK